MGSALLRAGLFLATMALGFGLKKAGVFKKEDRAILGNIIIFITLPASLINGFVGAKVSLWFLFCFGVGLFANLITLIVSHFMSRNKSPELRAIYTLNLPGFNLANITIPFLQSFFPTGIPYLCMFDMDDACFSLGTTNAIATNIATGKGNCKGQARSIVKSLLSSPPFVTYMVMTILSFAQLSLPFALMEFSGFLGIANGPLAMLMVGLSLEFCISKSDIADIFRILGSRYVCAIALSLAIFYLVPAPLLVRQISAIAMFSPLTSVSLIFSNRLFPKSTLASAMNPLSALISIPCMALLVAFMA